MKYSREDSHVKLWLDKTKTFVLPSHQQHPEDGDAVSP
jgi:hypothetical protein